MKLKPNARKIIRHSRTVRMAALSGLMSGAGAILPLFEDNIPRSLFAILALVFAVSAMVFSVMYNPRTEP